MKRLLSIILTAAILMTIVLGAVSAMGEPQAWDCPECGRTGNVGNFCGACGHVAPWIEKGEPQRNGEFWYVIHEDSTATIVGIDTVDTFKVPKELLVPAEIEGHPVVGIGDWAFYLKDIETVVISEGIKSIGEGAFELCDQLVDVTFPSTLEMVGDGLFRLAFRDNEKTMPTFHFTGDHCILSLQDGMLIDTADHRVIWASETLTGKVTVPEGTMVIGKRAFSGCHEITEFALPESLVAIRDDAFFSCFGVEQPLVIPASVTEIGESVFYNGFHVLIKEKDRAYYQPVPYIVAEGNSVFETVDGALIDRINHRLVRYYQFDRTEPYTVPEGIEYIAADAFELCTQIPEIILPEGLLTIGEDAFDYCFKVTSITIPSTVTEIKDSAFNGLSRLESITLPEGLKTLGRSVFRDCKALSQIWIPESVTSIGGGCFANCENLAEIHLPQISVIGASTFSGCKSLQQIELPDPLTEIKENAFAHCSALRSIYIPDQVSVIEVNAFQNCTSLVEVSMPANVTFKKSSVFAFNTSASENEVFAGCDQVVITKR